MAAELMAAELMAAMGSIASRDLASTEIELPFGGVAEPIKRRFEHPIAGFILLASFTFAMTAGLLRGAGKRAGQ
jgi:hypothetical protein